MLFGNNVKNETFCSIWLKIIKCNTDTDPYDLIDK